MVMIQSMVLSLIFLLIIPLCVGYLWCDTLSVPNNFPSMYVFGTFFVWSYSQLILVPMIIKDMSFTITSVIILTVTIVFVLIFFYWFHKNNSGKTGRHAKKFEITSISFNDKVCFGLMLAVVLSIIIHSVCLQCTDADDSRFVVLAMDAIKSDRMLRINPATGREFTAYLGEVSKDFSSPWTIYLAYVAKICGVKATILIHTILPPFIYLLISCSFWLLSGTLFEGQFSTRCLFVSFVWFIIVFSNYSSLNSETFIILRIWQGKAIVAGLTIPMLLHGIINIYRDTTWKNWANLSVVNLGSCLLSGNAIVIGVFMICTFGFIYSLFKKHYEILLFSIIICLTNCVFYVVYKNANHFL